ncbi:MAG: response regulator transcription factor [Sphingomonadaceae bacterium]|nr:response regulator transcription factor [Sphingomonadaceae bacterium]
MPPLRVLMCDDEPLALDRLGTLLERCEGVETIGAMLSGRALLDEVQALQPTLILLDIEMPQVDGFDVVEALSRMTWPAAAVPPLVIFVTAHPEFAVEAFDSGALDFISKPVRLSRLEQGLQRARDAAEQMEARQRLRELSAQLEDLKRARAAGGGNQHVWVRKGAETVRLEIGAIDWVEAEGEYVRIHAGGESYLERGSLTDAASRFAAHGFARIHRSAVVNPERVAAIDKTRWGSLVVRLVSGAEVPVGRKFRTAVQALTADGG